MRPWRTLLCAALLGAAIALPARADVPHPEAALSKALASGDWNRVAACFHERSGPLYDYVAGHFRQGPLTIGYAPLYQSAQLAGGLVSVKLADQTAGFPVEWQCWAGSWQVGEPLPVDDQGSRVTRHDLAVDLTRPDGVLRASDALTLTPTGPDRRVFLRLAPCLKVSAVTRGNQVLPFAQQGDMLYLQRPDAAVPITVTVAYSGTLPQNDWDFIRPDGTVLRSEFDWYPHTLGGTFAIYALRAKVPPGITAVGTGASDGIDRFSDAWVDEWTTSQPVDGETLYAGNYDHLAVPVDGCTLETYLPEARQAIAPDLLAEASRILGFYDAQFGRYPYRKLALVETGFLGGYGATSAIGLPHTALNTPQCVDDLLAHEIAHNWTGRLRYDGKPGEQGLMTEGVASYLDMLYHADRDGQEAFRDALSQARKRYYKLIHDGHDVPIAQADPGDQATWQTLTYDKGALVLHMLRDAIGPNAFASALRKLYAHDGTVVSLDDFRIAFEKASGQHLGWFFDEWLGRAGVPEFRCTGLHVQPLKGGHYLVTGHLQQSDDPYVIDVPLVAVTAHGGTLYRVPVRTSDTPFNLLVDERPLALMLDPLGDTLIAPQPLVKLK
ncbi:MAG TPA: M1 family aminopeptidase [Oscillatoriaceae cyanobacterium]